MLALLNISALILSAKVTKRASILALLNSALARRRAGDDRAVEPLLEPGSDEADDAINRITQYEEG